MDVYQPNTNKPDKIIVHHSAVSAKGHQFDAVNAYHEQEFNCLSSLGFYVGYHYFIEADGTTIQARAETDAGCHTIGANQSSIGICLAGNFDVNFPTAAQRNALVTLLDTLARKYALAAKQVFPHRKFNPKSCYGYNLSDTWAADQLVSYQSKTLYNTLWFLIQSLQNKISNFLYGNKTA